MSPLSIKRPCRKSGCRELTREKHGYCPKHFTEAKKKNWKRVHDKAKRDYPEQKVFYNSLAWRTKRKEILTKSPYCIVCNKLANIVDHITPLRLGGDQLSNSNLQPMCSFCHDKKRRQESIDARNEIKKGETKWLNVGANHNQQN